MSNMYDRCQPKLHDSEILPCQVQLKDLCDEMLSRKPEIFRYPFWNVPTNLEASEVQERLRASSFNDLLLEDGDTLSALETSESFPSLGLYVGSAALVGAKVRAWGKDFARLRRDPNGPEEPPYDIIYDPSEQDWSRRLDISLHFAEAEQAASETITIQTCSIDAGDLPSISREVYAMAYREAGYDGHSRIKREARSEAEVENFVALARELAE